MSDVLQPPFEISCSGEEGPQTDIEAACGGWRKDDQILYLSVATIDGRWSCRVSRRDMDELFKAIERHGVKITFGPCHENSKRL